MMGDEQVGGAAPQGGEHAGRGGQGDRDRPDGRGGVSHEDPHVVPILLVSERILFVESPPDVLTVTGRASPGPRPVKQKCTGSRCIFLAARFDLVIRWSKALLHWWAHLA